MKTRTQKRAEAAERQAKYDALTTLQKLTRAVGRGHSGTAEVARLRKLLDQEESSG